MSNYVCFNRPTSVPRLIAMTIMNFYEVTDIYTDIVCFQLQTRWTPWPLFGNETPADIVLRILYSFILLVSTVKDNFIKTRNILAIKSSCQDGIALFS